MTIDLDSLRRTRDNTRARLLAARDSEGTWTGELSSSALSTATAACALMLAARQGPADAARLEALAEGGRRWLVLRQNPRGGWGDTTDSPANISTTTLCWAALGLFGGEEAEAAANRAEAWMRSEIGELTPGGISAAICERYGTDRTFSVPILTMCALAGRFGGGPAAWRDIPALPFELGAVPRRWFSRIGLPVVSYALPALIAIGQVQHRLYPSRNPMARLLRRAAKGKTLRILTEIQPESGGFLEAAPLTSFVAMSLVGAGLTTHSVTQKCLGFLRETVRPDGSWPIDTNLRTWLTTLSIKALSRDGGLGAEFAAEARAGVREWLRSQQGRAVHPYTLAAPGGWAWTNLSGGVPDGDDTPGAILALHLLAEKTAEGRVQDQAITAQAAAGLLWLLGLQNRDGGIPTFCRGWGKLPFDESCPDLTAHTLRACFAWRLEMGEAYRAQLDDAAARAIGYLIRRQDTEGAWTPLWFGNQAAPGQENPVYGTALTLCVPELPSGAPFTSLHAPWAAARAKAVAWLLAAQEADGGWGGAPNISPSIEETALATDALCHCRDLPDATTIQGAIQRGTAWLARETQEGTRFSATPIGLYFAKLWYHEALYPLIFTASAMAGACAWLKDTETVSSAS